MKLIRELQEMLIESGAPTKFTVINVIRSILGAGHVSIDDKHVLPGQYLVRVGEHPTFSPPQEGKLEDWMEELGLKAASFPGVIEVPSLESRDAADVAQAAHEAYHAWMTVKSKGQIYKNEKFTNQLASKWLKKNLDGMQLHIALETILHSKIDYGHN